MNLDRTSRYLSFILRHKPEEIGITVEYEGGWADVKQLIAGIAKTRPFTMEILEEIVRTDAKGRYSFNADKTKIRANQGHSIPVDLGLTPVDPPETLFHGTATRFLDPIFKEGLKPMSRQWVQLSDDRATAVAVGKRHGTPYLFRVDAAAMARDGYAFYLSTNGVWMTKEVPVRYLCAAPINADISE